jgi:hypothetical protein
MGQNSPLSLARSVEARNAPELSPVRHRLRQAITIVATAQRELETATAPLQRPDTVVAATKQLKREASAATSSRRSRERSLNRGTQRRRPAATVASGMVLMIGRLIGVPASRRLWRRRRSFEASGGCGRVNDGLPFPSSTWGKVAASANAVPPDLSGLSGKLSP